MKKHVHRFLSLQEIQDYPDMIADRAVAETIKAISYYACIPIEELEAWVRDYKLISNKEN